MEYDPPDYDMPSEWAMDRTATVKTDKPTYRIRQVMEVEERESFSTPSRPPPPISRALKPQQVVQAVNAPDPAVSSLSQQMQQAHVSPVQRAESQYEDPSDMYDTASGTGDLYGSAYGDAYASGAGDYGTYNGGGEPTYETTEDYDRKGYEFMQPGSHNIPVATPAEQGYFDTAPQPPIPVALPAEQGYFDAAPAPIAPPSSSRGSSSTRPFQSNFISSTEEQLLPFPWYFRNVTRRDVELMMAHESDGCFVVRPGRTENLFVLSVCVDGTYSHMEIRSETAADRQGAPTVSWLLGGFSQPHSSIPNLVDYYRRHPIEIVGKTHISLTDDSYKTKFSAQSR
eukprot:m.5751 g.5751  ORF g.5751 m.5751 type:complete len:341 (+) comp5084_c0_seq1:100-1122(+)